MAVLLSSVGSLGLPIAAMLVLQPEAYGQFSLFYLAGAIANTLQLSLVSEAWIRAGQSDAVDQCWDAYGTATIMVALVGAGVAAGTSLFFPSIQSAAGWAFVAVFAQSLRLGTRFRAFRHFEWRYVLPTDLLGAIATIAAGIYLLVSHSTGLDTVMVCWAATRVFALVGTKIPKVNVREGIRWFPTHRREIRVLLSDSVISDLASIGTPYMITPVLGIAELGTYRAVSNIGGPFRSVIAPLRPALSRLPRETLASNGFAAKVIGASTLLGLAVSGLLVSLSRTDLSLGTLNSLYPYAPAVGLYVLGLVVSNLYSLIARQTASPQVILLTRVVVSVSGIVVPVCGALVWGLSGAVWGFAGCTFLAGVAWWVGVRRNAERRL